MKAKRIKLPDGTLLIEGFSKLIVIDRGFAEQHFPKDYTFEPYYRLQKGVACNASFFTTKKGREAIKISSGNSHIFRYETASGSYGWRGWDKRRIANGLFSEAQPTSNGGGCWMEIEIWDASTQPVSVEQQGYIEEISAS